MSKKCPETKARRIQGLFIYLFIYLASPQGQGHHNSVSQLLCARIIPNPPCQLSKLRTLEVKGEWSDHYTNEAPQHHPSPTHFLLNLRNFKALNFSFQIQGHFRTFKSCTNLDYHFLYS